MSSSSYNDTYSPQTVVRQVHKILHLNSALQKQDNTFYITTESTWNDYTKSLFAIPIICMSLGLLFVLIFQCVSCFTACCRKPGALDPDPRQGYLNLQNLRIAFVIGLLIVLVYDQSILFGSSFLGDGVSTASDSLDYLDATFTTLNNYGDDLNDEGYDLQEDFNKSYQLNNCSQAEDLNSYMSDYFGYVEDYTSLIAEIPDKVENAQDVLHQYGVDYKNKSVYVFYAMFIVCIAIYAVAMLFSQKWAVYAGIGTSNCVVTITFILVGVEMVILMLLADFCMEPTENLLLVAPDSVYNMTAFYTTCVGENPLDSSLQSAEELIAEGRAATQAVLNSTCPGDQYLQQALGEFDVIDAVIANITSLISCPPNQEQTLRVLNDGLCGDAFKGVYTIWLGQFVCAAGVLICSIIVACASPYFGAWSRGGSGKNVVSPVRRSEADLYGGSNNMDIEYTDAEARDSEAVDSAVVYAEAQPVRQPMTPPRTK